MKDGYNCSERLIGRVQQRALIFGFPIFISSCVGTFF